MFSLSPATRTVLSSIFVTVLMFNLIMKVGPDAFDERKVNSWGHDWNSHEFLTIINSG